MAEYEPVVHGGNTMKLTRTDGPSAVYENVIMTQTTTAERQDEPREERGGPGRDTPATKKEEGICTTKVKIVVFCVVGMLTLGAVATSLGISFVQMSKQTMQLKKSETENNKTSQFIEILQRNLQSLETRLNVSEETIKFLSARCQSLDSDVSDSQRKLSSINTTVRMVGDIASGNQQKLSSINNTVRMVGDIASGNQQKLSSINTTVRMVGDIASGNQQKLSSINTTVRMVGDIASGNQQKLSSINTTVRMVGDIASGNQQKLASINITMQTTSVVLQNLGYTVFNRYHPACSSGDYRYNPYSGSCYKVVKSFKNWNDSKVNCTASGEFLATFVTTESVDWLGYMRSINAWDVGSNHLWVGGYKSPAGWKWTGRVTVPVDSSVWAPGQPSSGDCMENDIDDTLSSLPCNRAHYFMCETDGNF